MLYNKDTSLALTSVSENFTPGITGALVGLTLGFLERLEVLENLPFLPFQSNSVFSIIGPLMSRSCGGELGMTGASPKKLLLLILLLVGEVTMLWADAWCVRVIAFCF